MILENYTQITPEHTRNSPERPESQKWLDDRLYELPAEYDEMQLMALESLEPEYTKALADGYTPLEFEDEVIEGFNEDILVNLEDDFAVKPLTEQDKIAQLWMNATNELARRTSLSGKTLDGKETWKYESRANDEFMRSVLAAKDTAIRFIGSSAFRLTVDTDDSSEKPYQLVVQKSDDPDEYNWVSIQDIHTSAQGPSRLRVVKKFNTRQSRDLIASLLNY